MGSFCVVLVVLATTCIDTILGGEIIRGALCSGAREPSPAYLDRLLAAKIRRYKSGAATGAENLTTQSDRWRTVIRPDDCPSFSSPSNGACYSSSARATSGPIRLRTTVPWRETTVEGRAPYTLWPRSFTYVEMCPLFMYECQHINHGMVAAPISITKYLLQAQNTSTCERISKPGEPSLIIRRYELVIAQPHIAIVCVQEQ